MNAQEPQQKEAALVQDVLDHPDDAAPLQALAGWLEGRGDPRGEVLTDAVEAAQHGSGEGLARLRAQLPQLLPPERLLSAVRWWDLAAGVVVGALLDTRTLAEDLARGVRMAQVYDYVHDPGTWLGDAGAEALAADPNAASLRSLTVQNHRIGPAGVRALASSPHLAGLVELRLDGNPAFDEGVEALASSPHLRRLEVLGLGRTGISPRGVRALLSSALAARLMELDFSGTSIPWVSGSHALGAEGARALAEASLPRLRVLRLGEHSIGAEGARALAAWPTLRQLRWLTLARNGLGEQGLRALAGSPYLGPVLALETSQNHVDGGEWRDYTDWDGTVASSGWEDVSAREDELARKGIVFPPGVRIY